MEAKTTASIGDAKMPEDMQDYLARMNKQLEEMAAQHLQTVAPRRESLARATARYLERKASQHQFMQQHFFLKLPFLLQITFIISCSYL
ncbi:hypothetical protein OEZ86_006106 [Tetradesmus obliquus]|nr:hypothetical protein OEZ86_006106 [Tetradesmus obliquus]